MLPGTQHIVITVIVNHKAHLLVEVNQSVSTRTQLDVHASNYRPCWTDVSQSLLGMLAGSCGLDATSLCLMQGEIAFWLHGVKQRVGCSTQHVHVVLDVIGLACGIFEGTLSGRDLVGAFLHFPVQVSD